MHLEIFDVETKRNFKPWLEEKVIKAIEECFYAKENTESKAERCHIEEALKRLLTIYFAVNGKTKDVEILENLFAKKNLKFFHKFQSVALLDNKTDAVKIAIPETEVYEQIKKLITPENRRTQLAMAIQEYQNCHGKGNSWMEGILNDLELVHSGIKTWDWFYSKHKNDETCYEVWTYKDLIDMEKEV